MSWEHQFRNSLSRFSNTRNACLPSVSQPEIKSELGPQVFSIAVSELAQLYLSRPFNHLNKLVAVCQSHIEEAMLYALCISCQKHADSIRYVIGNRVFGDIEQGINSFTIQPQAYIAGIRVDFLVTYERLSEFIENDDPNYSEFRETRQMVIECDGHDYHYRTKEQAQNDRQRDRLLQRRGLQVFRYTGSEIFSDVFECAEEVVEVLLGKYLSE